MRIRPLEQDRGGSHVGSRATVGRAPTAAGRAMTRGKLSGHRCDRRAGGVRPDGFRRCRPRNALPGRVAGGHGDARVVRGERRDPGARARTRSCSRRRPGSTSRPTRSPTARSRSRSTATCRASPDDVFTWFAGYRMQFFAAKGLATPIDDVWKIAHAADAAGVQGRVDGRSTGTSTSCRTKNYPWAVYYRKSLWKEKGYTAPTTWAQFVALAKKMKADGLTPIAFTDKDGWPPMGTFDIINMRINGYDFHVRLMAGKQSWDSPQVKAVFNKWRELFPYYSEGALGLTLAGRRGSSSRTSRPACSCSAGSSRAADEAGKRQGHRLLPVPGHQPEVGAGLDRCPDRRLHDLEEGRRTSTARRSWSGSSAPRRRIDTTSRSTRATSARTGARTRRKYTPLQKKAAKLIAATKHIAQYMDRDTRPDFASTVMIPSLQSSSASRATSTSSCRASRSRRRRSSGREPVVVPARWRPTSQRARGWTARAARKRAVRLSTGDRIAMTVMVGDPGASHRRADLVPDDLVDRALVHELGRDRRRSTRSSGPGRRTTARSRPSTRRSGRRSGTTSIWLGALAFVGDAVRDVPRLPARQADPRLAVLPEHLLHPGRDRARDHRLHRPARSTRRSRA